MTDLAPLHSDDAERSVLGGLIMRPALIKALDLAVLDFFAPRHQLVYQAIRNLDADGLAVDATTIADEIRRLGKLGVFGDDEGRAIGYIAGELQLHVPSAENTEAYAKILGRYAMKRQAVEVLGGLLHRLRSRDDADGDDVVLEAIGELQRIDLRVTDPTRALGDLMRDECRSIYLDADRQARGEHVGGMPSGIRLLDQFTGGFPIGSVTLVLGETGHGKSTYGMCFARAAVELANDRPLLFSYEDGAESFARRALAQDSDVPTQVIGRRSFRGAEAERVALAGKLGATRRRERIAAWRGQPVEELCRTVRRLRARGPEHGATSVGRLVIADYLQAIPKPTRRGISTPEAIGENHAALEDLAAQERIAVVVLSQVNDEPSRRSDDHRPQLRDVAGSRDPAKGCKLALGLFRPVMYGGNHDPHLGEVSILKNNQGETNRTIPVRLNLETHTIRDAPDDSSNARRYGS